MVPGCNGEQDLAACHCSPPPALQLAVLTASLFTSFPIFFFFPFLIFINVYFMFLTGHVKDQSITTSLLLLTFPSFFSKHFAGAENEMHLFHWQAISQWPIFSCTVAWQAGHFNTSNCLLSELTFKTWIFALGTNNAMWYHKIVPKDFTAKLSSYLL